MSAVSAMVALQLGLPSDFLRYVAKYGRPDTLINASLRELSAGPYSVTGRADPPSL